MDGAAATFFATQGWPLSNCCNQRLGNDGLADTIGLVGFPGASGSLVGQWPQIARIGPLALLRPVGMGQRRASCLDGLVPEPCVEFGPPLEPEKEHA
eukprot:2249782-Lingulodinium_polyedra.AAC.1